jgi:putative flippase GtrA
MYDQRDASLSNVLPKEMRFFRSLASVAKTSRVIRFLLVGVLNATFSYLIYALLLFVGLGYQLANLCSLLLGILFSFKTQGHLVFRNSDNRLLGRFVLSWLLIYVCNITVIGRIIAFGFNAYVAGALTLPIIVSLSYLVQKYFVFRQVATKKAETDQA